MSLFPIAEKQIYAALLGYCCSPGLYSVPPPRYCWSRFPFPAKAGLARCYRYWVVYCHPIR